MPGVASGGRVYVFGGGGKEGFVEDCEVINISTGAVAALPTKFKPRRFHTAEIIEKSAYLVGGFGPDGYQNVLERFDLKTGKVELRRPIPTPRSGCASVAANGLLWVIGGSVPGGFTGAVEIYDPRTDKWESGPPLPTPRESTAIYHSGLIHTIGGYAGTAGMRTWEAYSINNGTWSRMPDLPASMSAHHMALIGERVITFGDYAVKDRVLACDLLRLNWFRPRLSQAYIPRRHAAVVTIGETIFVIGGNTASNDSYLDTVQMLHLMN